MEPPKTHPQPRESVDLSRKRLCAICGIYTNNPCRPAYPKVEV